MKKIVTVIIAVFLYTASYCQTDTCFTQEQVINIANNILELQHEDSLKGELIRELKYQTNLYESALAKDSILLYRKDQEIELYKVRCKLYEDLARINKPKWYENKYISFLFGAGTIITASWVVFNIK